MLRSTVTGLSTVAAAAKVQRREASPQGEWRNPCDEADIPWKGETGPFNFAADGTTNVTSRTHQLRRVWAKERVFVEAGDSKDIVVDYQIKFTDEDLQDAITLEKNDSNLILTIDTTGYEDDDPRFRECIVVETSVKVPKEISHLILDNDNASVKFDDVDSAFKFLELHSKNGAVGLKESNIGAEELLVTIKNGAFVTDHSTVSSKKANVKSANGHIAARFSGDPLETLVVSTQNGAVDLILAGKDDSTTTAVTASSAHGRVQIQSYLPGTLKLNATSTTGHVSTEIYSKKGGKIHASTEVGKISLDGPIDVTKEKKGLLSSLVEGTYGQEKGDSVVDLETRVGAISFYVGEAQDGALVEPMPLDMGPGDPSSGFEPGHPHHPRHAVPSVLMLIGVVLIAAVAFHSIRRIRARNSAREGYVKI